MRQLVLTFLIHCFRLTRSTEDNGELCQQSFLNPTSPLRVSVLQKTTLRVLRVSPKAIARAFKSFHLLLTLNTEYRGKGAWRSDILSLCVHWNAYACDVYTIFLSNDLYFWAHLSYSPDYSKVKIII